MSVLYKHESESDFEMTRDDDGAYVLVWLYD